MNKFKFLIPVSAFALSLLFTNCVDNSESEGVKAMRTAQAELISAKANAERLKAEADAALASAQLEVEAAKAANQLLINTKLELENEKTAIDLKLKELALKLQEEENTQMIAAIKMEVELAQARHAAAIATQEALLITAKANIETAQMNADITIKQAEQDMKDALAEIEAATDVADEKNKEALNTLRDEYRALLADIVDAKTEIINKTTELAKLDLSENVSIAEQRAAIALDVADNKINTLVAKEWLAKYEAINTANDNEGLYETALAEIVTLENSKNIIAEEMPAAQEKMDDAETVMDAAADAKGDAIDALQEAYDAYFWAYGWQNTVKILNDEDINYMTSLSNIKDIDGKTVDFLKMFDKELDTDLSNLYFIYSKKEYEDIISDINSSDDLVAKTIKERDFALQILSYMNSQSKLSTFKDAHTAAKADLATAESDYELASAAYKTASDEYGDIAKRVDDVSTEIVYTESYADALKATKEAVDELIEDEKDNILDLENDLTELENDLLVVDFDEVDWTSKKAVKELEISNLQEKLVDYESDAAAVKAEIDELLK